MIISGGIRVWMKKLEKKRDQIWIVNTILSMEIVCEIKHKPPLNIWLIINQKLKWMVSLIKDISTKRLSQFWKELRTHKMLTKVCRELLIRKLLLPWVEILKVGISHSILLLIDTSKNWLRLKTQFCINQLLSRKRDFTNTLRKCNSSLAKMFRTR